MKDQLIAAMNDLGLLIVEKTPQVLMGIGLVLLAFIVAKVIEKILRIIIVRIKLDALVKRAGIDQTLQRVGIRQELNRFLPRLAYFLILFLLGRTAADALGLTAISDAFGAFLSYLPNLIAALLLLIIGSAAAQFAGAAVRNSASSAGLDFAPSLGRVVSAFIMFIVGIMAFGQLKIDTDIIRLVTSFVLAGAALAFGLSFGLGTRGITRQIFAGFYAKKMLDIGANVDIEGQSGRLRAITPTHTILETDDGTVHLSNEAFLDGISKQKK